MNFCGKRGRDREQLTLCNITVENEREPANEERKRRERKATLS